MARASIRLSFPTVIADDVWWQELRPEEGGRSTVVHQAADGVRTEPVVAPWNACTRVHEYGGMSYLPVPTGAGGWEIVFANYADQRLYLTQATSARTAPDAGPAAVPGAAEAAAAEADEAAAEADEAAAEADEAVAGKPDEAADARMAVRAAGGAGKAGAGEPAAGEPAAGAGEEVRAAGKAAGEPAGSAGKEVRAAGAVAAGKGEAAAGAGPVVTAEVVPGAAAEAGPGGAPAAGPGEAAEAAPGVAPAAGPGEAPEAGPAADEAPASAADPPATAERAPDAAPHAEPTAAGAAGPRPLTPDPAEPAGLRYADFVLSPDGTEIWCVREQHGHGSVTRAIVAVPLDGSAADDPAAVRELVTGSDFYAFPTPSPDGSRLAWICWNHPRMPWDGTELRVAVIENRVPGKSRHVKGGVAESVLAPCWRDNSSLYVVSDWSGWWNIYQVSLVGEPHEALYPAEEEFASPLWQLGRRPYAVLGDGRLAVLHGQGNMRLGLLDPANGELADLDLPYDAFGPSLAADGTAVVAVAGAPATPPSVVRVDAADGSVERLRCELDKVPDAAYLPVPRSIQIEGLFGRIVHALVYPPSNPAATAPEGELPPYVAWVHGGPTGNETSMLDLEKAYFTSRGIGVIDVNYGGSTGYGRAYRERLRRQWGIVDVEDVIAAARGLAVTGEADPQRLAIRGRSAGGWTSLCALTTGAAKHGKVFSAAASYFGPANLEEFARQTHDFESRYLDGLVGPMPGFVAAYRERSPSGHVTDATGPILVLQGMDDPVVPPEQSESIVRELAEHGIKHAYLAFDGESHGFRRADSVIASLEAELSFYGQILGFKPPGIPILKLEGDD